MSALHERSALTQLAPGERLLGYGTVVPAKSAKGIGPNITQSLANDLVNSVGAQSGGAGSIAAQMPGTSGALLLRVTDQRVGLVRPLDGTPVWEVPRAWVIRVERRPRTQLMARFRVHYADGSWLAFLTMRRRTIEQFRSLIG
ncbi:hypothetical protein GCM10010260_55650 [Streptomyces filipinensis]|uniref:Uncharacterized protein n=1 Tax=Streptomyces filipinensis TaxID=66887 RepID=A0A918IGL0_9ACTN|nr:hypothetical protein [Streptomyces filipinensis]GGV09981.1 hypothetical protein GCM10010260_55650 [Streptomyces filipinensis]